MTRDAEQHERVFKTAWFSKAARKAFIPDAELCWAIRQVMLGQADDLGGGVFKKRLSRNQYRSIVVAKGGRYWVYTFLFAKQDQANVSEPDLARFRRFASLFAQKTDEEVASELVDKDLVEICHEQKAKISK